MASRKTFLLIISATVLLGGAWYWVSKQKQTEKPAATADSAENNIAGNERTKEGATDASPHDHELESLLIELATKPGKYPHFDFNKNRFTPPALDANGDYLPSQTTLQLDNSCNSENATPDVKRLLENQLREDYAMEGSRRVPEDVFFESLSQFFKVAERYYQFSAFAKAGSRPPIYDIEFYSADDPGMSKNLSREALPVTIGGQVDAPAVATLLSQVLAHYRSPQFQEGARLMDVRITGRIGEQDSALRYFNALPVQWVFSGGLCQLTDTQASTYCRCLPKGEVLHAAEY